MTSIVHALSDDQVNQELKKMIAFIKQEAMEKAREVHIKADEEFAIEKAKLVRHEQTSIDANYEKKTKAVSMQQQITKSNIINRTRLQVLAARQETLDGIFEDARQRLPDAIQTSGLKPEELYTNLILQALASYAEVVTVKARTKDHDVVNKAISSAAKKYQSQTHLPVKLSLDEKNTLPAECAGGVTISGLNGKIEIVNILDERLRLLESEALPFIRVTLFGKSETRKFFH
ncbi:V-type proton ATPase subunit E [Neolecta irregularis DAH-3]|uniref:V-type proton ATPase subunit E n=1 Tax=Neolecta irregularis (strain DAH-3) TaxID=1198029 RepID=A0A1U7LST7_NEOID|nr:V-type proton ATPase subunit E [Neolecta irregularis DAH-3]|eukprot:OLL25581.1 V-type proton ATPase subunit E [Neolecta irregularis DAH-3]